MISKLYQKLITTVAQSNDLTDFVFNIVSGFKEELKINAEMTLALNDEIVSSNKDYVDNEEQREKILTLSSNRGKVILNSRLVELEELSQNKNELFLPLDKGYKFFGYVFLKFRGELLSIGDLMSISKLLSFAIENILNTKNHEKKLKFHSSVEMILRSLQTGYEKKKIIPQIGASIDRFIEDNLIYIFSHDNGYKLEWPASYPASRIDPLFASKDIENGYIGKDFVIFPLKSNDKLTGAIALDGRISPIEEQDIGYLERLSMQSSAVLESAMSYQNALKEAKIDMLTGLLNRRELEKMLHIQTSMAKRKKQPLCVCMLDIDYFKKINDSYGHRAGDMVLKKMAEILNSSIRDYDLAARYGGEEFCIILPQTDMAQAKIIAERIRGNIAKTVIKVETIEFEIKDISITASIGIANYREEEPIEFIAQADKALYQAKETGRNKVVVMQ